MSVCLSVCLSVRPSVPQHILKLTHQGTALDAANVRFVPTVRIIFLEKSLLVKLAFNRNSLVGNNTARSIVSDFLLVPRSNRVLWWIFFGRTRERYIDRLKYRHTKTDRQTDRELLFNFVMTSFENLYFTTYGSITTIQCNRQYKTIEHNKLCELN